MDLDFANRLKTLRTEHDLTIDMLVTDLNRAFPESKVNKSMVSRWESGINNPSLENAKNVSVYFNVSLDYLIGLTDTRTPSRLLALKRMATYQKEVNDIGKLEDE
jgi:transcriptional regulator with XRE-family HTH domain